MLFIRCKGKSGNVLLINMNMVECIREREKLPDLIYSDDVEYEACPYNCSGGWLDALFNPMEYMA